MIIKHLQENCRCFFLGYFLDALHGMFVGYTIATDYIEFTIAYALWYGMKEQE